MKLSSFLHAGLFVSIVAGTPCAYGQRDFVDSVSATIPFAAARSNELYFDGIKAKNDGDGKKAGEFFAQFIALNPKEPAAYYELSTISYNEKRIEEADEYIKKALALNPNNKWYKEQHASILADKGEFLEAAAIMADLTKSEKQDRNYALMAAEYYDRAHKYEEAITYLDIAITRNGPDEEIMKQKVRILLSLNSVDRAAEVVKQLIIKEPDNGKYYKWLGELYDKYNMPQAALDVYKQAQKLLPSDPFIQIGVAEHYLKIGDSAAYRSHFKSAITNSDFDSEIQTELLKTYLQAMPNDSMATAEGLPIIKEIVAAHPKDADALTFLGEMFAYNNELDSAVIAYKRSLAIKPSSFDTWDRLLSSFGEPKNADSLIKYSEKAMKLFPNMALVHFYNSIGHMNKKEYPAAIRAVNRAIDMQPESNKAALIRMYSLQAELYHTNKQDTLSDKAFDKVLLLDPGNVSALNNYSYFLSERGVRLSEAEQMSKKSLELSPGISTFLDTYGWILYKQGNYAKAKEYIQQAIDGAGANADATLYDHLGNVCFKLNDRDKAVQYWKIAREKGGDDPQLDKKISEGKLYE